RAGDLPPDDTADAGRDRLGVRRDRDVRPTAGGDERPRGPPRAPRREPRAARLAESLEGKIATVFRQTAMNRFEDAVHTERREQGELSVDRFGELWAESQTAMRGDAGEVTD